MDKPRITKDTFGHSTLHFHEGELPITDPFILWLDEEIKFSLSHWIGRSKSHTRPRKVRATTLQTVKEKYLSLKQQ